MKHLLSPLDLSVEELDKLLDVAETLTEHNAAAVVKKIMGRYDLFNNPESMLKFEVKIRMQDGGANDNKDNAIGNKIRAVSCFSLSYSCYSQQTTKNSKFLIFL